MPENRIPVKQKNLEVLLGHCLGQLQHPGGNMDESIHEARKCFKKIRAAFRLVRGAIGDDGYTAGNRCFRDAGRKLSAVRGSGVMIETLEDLHEYFGEQFTLQVFQGTNDVTSTVEKAFYQFK
jgi:CHAD domain-containing protein